MEDNNSPTYHYYRSSILIAELERGQRAAGQLRDFLIGTGTGAGTGTGTGTANNNSSSPQDEDISAVDLTSIILACFSSCLSIITCPLPNDKKTHYHKKRSRKTSSGQSNSSSSRVVESPTLTDDGYAWRKYGQKPILNAPHPRHYYRCTYKMDQGCQSTKWVQKVSDEPSIYRTFYEGQHTCKSPLTIRVASSEVLLLAASPPADHSNNSYKFLSFGGSAETDNNHLYSTNNNNNQDASDGGRRILHSFLFSSSVSPAASSTSVSTISLKNQNSSTTIIPTLEEQPIIKSLVKTDHDHAGEDHHRIRTPLFFTADHDRYINRSLSPSDHNNYNNYSMMMSQYLSRDQDIYYNGDIEGGAAYSCSASSDNIHSNLDDNTMMMGMGQNHHLHNHNHNHNQLEAVICNIFDMDYLSSPN